MLIFEVPERPSKSPSTFKNQQSSIGNKIHYEEIYYNGLWHDDFTWPHIGLPELQKTPVMRDAIAWLTDAMVDL